jgi:hypothetical protein
MTTDVQDAQADAEAAKNAVDDAEANLVSGKRSVTADALHKLTDRWRHADLTAQRARLAAEEERRDARLKGLEVIGAEVDKLAQPEHTEQLAEAVRDIAVACARFNAVAGAHDADLADLIAAATDLRAEPAAPGGPRGTSSFIAVKGGTITHRRVVITPLAGHAQAALAHATRGDINRAVAEVRAATTAPEPKRPDHLLRNIRSGNIVTIYGELNDGMRAQLRASNPRSGEIEELSDHDIDLYMKGELA